MTEHVVRVRVRDGHESFRENIRTSDAREATDEARDGPFCKTVTGTRARAIAIVQKRSSLYDAPLIRVPLPSLSFLPFSFLLFFFFPSPSPYIYIRVTEERERGGARGDADDRQTSISERESRFMWLTTVRQLRGILSPPL